MASFTCEEAISLVFHDSESEFDSEGGKSSDESLGQGRTLGGGVGGGVTPPQLFKIGRKSVPKNAYQITSSVPEHPIY